MYDHINEALTKTDDKVRNPHKTRTIRKIIRYGEQPVIEIIQDGLDEESAFRLEVELIAKIGRYDKGTGPLTNKTDGGEGFCGVDHSGSRNSNYGRSGLDAHFGGHSHKDSTKELMSAWQIGQPKPEEAKQNMRHPKSEEGRKAIAKARAESTYRPSEDHKKKISIAMTGRVFSRNHKRKIGEKSSIRANIIVTCPHCRKVGKQLLMSRWHFDNCREVSYDNR
jgi:hypothetical protein